MFFSQNKKDENDFLKSFVNKNEREMDSSLGRPITTIKNATKNYFFEKIERIDPLNFLNKKGNYNFYGNDLNNDEPIYIKNDDTTHEILIGSTGTGKGVFLGNKVKEALQRKQGLIIIDPKQDNFLPQICKEELIFQNREDDLKIISYPYNFNYGGIYEDDDHITITNKLRDALSIQETENPATSYYNKNARTLLRRVLAYFFNGKLGKKISKDLIEITKHIRYLKEDLEKIDLFNKEIVKAKPNYNLISKFSKTFFNKDILENIYWDNTTIETLDSLSKSLSEIAESAFITNELKADLALYEGQVLYFKVDMLDTASLKMIKLMICDVIQKAREKKANCQVICDEISFYANETLSGALATVRSFGLKFILALQDLAQMKEGIREAILSNCNIKVFYKISDLKTLEYIEKISGLEAVTKYSQIENARNFSQELEASINTTIMRALPRSQVAILIAEALPSARIIKTNFIEVKEEFNWNFFNEKKSFFCFNEDLYNFDNEKDLKKYIENDSKDNQNNDTECDL